MKINTSPILFKTKIGVIGLIVIIVAIMLFSMTLCTNFSKRSISTGYRFSITQIDFPGFVALKLEKRTFIIGKEDVEVTFHYGHKYAAYDLEDEINGHTISVYLAKYPRSMSLIPENFVLLKEINFENESFVNTDNELKNDKMKILRKIEYNQSFNLSIDFSLIDFDNGVLVVEMIEYRTIHEDSQDIDINQARFQFIYFQRTNDRLQFQHNEFS
jgi:hypothetical protein